MVFSKIFSIKLFNRGGGLLEYLCNFINASFLNIFFLEISDIRLLMNFSAITIFIFLSGIVLKLKFS